MTFNLLSILLSLAMMLTGATGLEADAPMASSLTIRDIYLDYNDTNLTLEPSLTAGVMTDNGTAVFDLSMACGEESLFPMQLVVTEDAATLVVEKTGKAFTMDADTLNALVSEALDLDRLTMDAETTEAFNLLADSFKLSLAEPSFEVNDEALNAQITEMLEPVETSTGTAYYNDTEYEVTNNRYIIDNDQMFEIMDLVYASSEEFSAYYSQIVDLYNEALTMDVAEGEEPIKAESLKDIYAQMGMTMSMDLVESTSADGLFSQTTGSVTVSSTDLPEPVVVSIDAYEVDGIVDTLVECDYIVEDMALYMGAVVYQDETDEYFEAILELMPVESESSTEEDYSDAVSFYVTGGSTPGAEGSTEYGFNMEINADGGAFAFVIDGIENEDGTSTTDIGFDFADDTDTIAFGLTLDYSNAVFANAAEGLEPIVVNPETFESIEAEFEPVAESLMVDLQTLIENESVTDMIAAFTAINSMDYATAEVTTVEVAENEANTELTFNEPTFAYLPEGMAIEDTQVDVEYNSVSCTIADANYDNVIYVYVYGDLYSSGTTNYALGADGSLTAVEDRVVSVQIDEDAVYAEMQDGDVIVSLSCFGEEIDAESIGKLLSGMAY